MAGTVRGKIDCYSRDKNPSNNNQEIFTNWINFMQDLVTAGVATLVASQYGTGGTGFDFHDGANPSGTNAFAVYRFPAIGSRTNDWYVLGQWSESNDWGDGVGSPGRILGSLTGNSGGNFGLVFASALESDGTTNAVPWTGTTLGDGTDSKSTPVWAAPFGGSLAIWPISNNDGNIHGTNKENSQRMVTLSTVSPIPNVRYGFIADNDCFFCYFDVDGSTSTEWSFFGTLEPINGVNLDYNLAFIKDFGELGLLSTRYGSSSGNSNTDGGFHNYVTGSMDSIYIGSMTSAFNLGANPNSLNSDSDINTFDFFPLIAYMDENSVNRQGTIGLFDPFIQSSINILKKFQTPDFTYSVFGSEFSVELSQIIVPWDGVTPIGSTHDRNGVDF